MFGEPMAKLLGRYEMELVNTIEECVGIDRIVNIGAGEGYYAVGLQLAYRRFASSP